MIRNLIIVIAVLALIANCKPKDTQEEIQQAKDVEQFDETTAAIAEEFKGMVSTVGIAELGGQLEAAGAEFNESFVNDPANVDSYIGNEVLTAANVGIYYVDMNYLAANGKRDMAVASYSAAQKLANEIGVGRFFDQAVLERFQENMTEEGKAALISSMEDASRNLNTQNRPRVTAMMLGGVLIERLHILGAIIDEAEENEDLTQEQLSLLVTPIMKAIIAQKDNITQVIEYLNLVRTDEDPKFFTYLYTIDNEFKELENLKEQLDRTEPVSPGVLDNLYIDVNEIRTQIVNPSAE